MDRSPLEEHSLGNHFLERFFGDKVITCAVDFIWSRTAKKEKKQRNIIGLHIIRDEIFTCDSKIGITLLSTAISIVSRILLNNRCIYLIDKSIVSESGSVL